MNGKRSIRILGFIKHKEVRFSPKIKVLNPSPQGFLEGRTLQAMNQTVVTYGSIRPEEVMIFPNSYVGGATTTYNLYFIP